MQLAQYVLNDTYVFNINDLTCLGFIWFEKFGNCLFQSYTWCLVEKKEFESRSSNSFISNEKVVMKERHRGRLLPLFLFLFKNETV